jgi:hypothetical protein
VNTFRGSGFAAQLYSHLIIIAENKSPAHQILVEIKSKRIVLMLPGFDLKFRALKVTIKLHIAMTQNVMMINQVVKFTCLIFY